MKRNLVLFVFSVVLCAVSGLYAADIIVAPNPWVPQAGKANTGTLAGGMNFRNLPSDGNLYIYTVSGSLVLKQQLSDSAGTFNWNGKNGSGADVASGVYLWVVSSASSTRNGKLVVVR